jgi:protein SCO1/2
MKKLLMYLMLMSTVHAVTQLGINENLGTMVPLDLTFINEKGERVTLKKLMDGKPTMISLNYFRCAGICTPQLNDMAKMLGRLDLAENTDYKVLTIGFAEDEGYELAAAKRNTMLKTIQREYVQDAWHFVVGENNSSGILANKVGFEYEKTVSPAGVVDYVHPAALIMLSPEGKDTRYINVIEQLPFDVKMALMEAGQGKVGPTIAKNLLYCFAYDPKAKTYIFKWEKIAGAVMTLIMLAFFIYLVRTSRREEDPQHNKGDN